jgi:hypothetical protein
MPVYVKSKVKEITIQEGMGITHEGYKYYIDVDGGDLLVEIRDDEIENDNRVLHLLDLELNKHGTGISVGDWEALKASAWVESEKTYNVPARTEADAGSNAPV